MKRDLDLIRELMLLIEAKCEPEGIFGRNFEVEGHDYVEVMGHLNLMSDANFIFAEQSRTSTGRIIATEIVFDLTWSGHEFLDTIRDPEIWRKTKSISRKIGSSSFDFVIEIAKGLVRDNLQTLGFSA